MLRRMTVALIAVLARAAAPAPANAQGTSGLGGWLPALALLALLVTLAALVAFAVADWRSYRQRGARRGYRHRRTAHERFATSVELQRRAIADEQVVAPPAQDNDAEDEGQDEDEDALLRQLLGQ
jgi:hypothetical protein